MIHNRISKKLDNALTQGVYVGLGGGRLSNVLSSNLYDRIVVTIYSARLYNEEVYG
jgi:hypothetical protein